MSSRRLMYLGSVFLICCFLACENPEITKSEELISKALNQKIDKFKSNKRRECDEQIRLDAEVLVDSIIAQQLHLDTIQFPNRPVKPSTPDIKEIPEELLLQPIKFNSTSDIKLQN